MTRIKFISQLIMIFCSGLVFAESAKPLLNIQNWQTQNGMRVYFVAAPTLPILDIEMLFDAGSSREAEKQGLAALTNTLLNAGGTSDTNDTISEAFSAVGAQVGTNARKDMASIRLRTLTAQQAESKAIDLMGKMLKPAFRTSDLEREKANLVKAIQQKQDYPEKIAQDLFFKTLYGAHPYAHPSIGSIESVKVINDKDLHRFFDTYYVAKNASLVIVGALDTKGAKQLSETLSTKLPSGNRASELPKPVFTHDVVARKEMNTQQSQIIYGALGASRLEKDWSALYVGNEILGGGTFDSRMFMDIREKGGLAYRVGSYFIPMTSTGPWLASLQTRNEKQDEALSRVQKLVSDFIAKGPTDDEVTAAKQNIVSGFPLSFRSNDSIIDTLAIIAFYNLPLSYYDDFLSSVKMVKAADVHAAFQRQFASQSFVTVIVGQESTQDVKNKTKSTAK